ncbi:SprB [Candidatus Symbiothrix dinenymphae]|nr:SprB [Candidatus Symbiothrix dinenymphae]
MKVFKTVSLIMFLCVCGNMFAQNTEVARYGVYITKVQYSYHKKAHDFLGWGCNGYNHHLARVRLYTEINYHYTTVDINEDASAYVSFDTNKPTGAQLYIEVGEYSGDKSTKYSDKTPISATSAIISVSDYDWSGDCKRDLTVEESIVVDGPAEIDDVKFDGLTTPYCCNTTNIKIWTKKYYSNGMGNAEIQILDKNNVWQTITTAYSYASSRTISYAQVLQHVNLAKPIKFRTKKKLKDNSYSYSYSTKFLYYLPQFKFPAGKTVIVEPPSCFGGNTIIKVPYEGNTKYTLTTSALYGSSWGVNVETDTLQPVNGYYVFSGNFSAGKHVLKVEYKTSECPTCACPFTYIFSVPEIPQFKITAPASFEFNTSGYQIKSTASNATGRVYFLIENSPTTGVTVHAKNGVEQTQQISSRQSTAIDGRTYYSGTVYIDLPADTYNWEDVYVKSGTPFDCRADYPYSQNIILNQPDAITFTATPTTPNCNNAANRVSGDTTGAIILSNIAGGIGGYNYKVDNIDFTTERANNRFSSLSTGNHTVTVSDTFGNVTIQENVYIPTPAPISVSYSITQQPSLRCTSDGAIKITAHGGKESFSYSQVNSSLSFDTQDTFTGYASDVPYVVYVKDTCDCIVEQPVTLPPILSLAIHQRKDSIAPTCYGGEDGSYRLVMKNRRGTLFVTATDATNTPVPSGRISVVDSTITLTGEAGTYSCDVTDKNGKGESCDMVTVEFTIPPKAAMQVISKDTIAPICHGESTGKCTLKIANRQGTLSVSNLRRSGTEVVAYDQIANGDHITIDKLPVGTYSCTINDAINGKSCSIANVTFTIPDKPAMRVTSKTETPPSCFDYGDGRCTLLVEHNQGVVSVSNVRRSGIAVAYSQTSGSGGNAVTITDLAAGDYTCAINDATGCAINTSFSVPVKPAMYVFTKTETPPICHGDNTGTCQLVVKNRQGNLSIPYLKDKATNVSISGYSQTSDGENITIGNLAAGTYICTIQDGKSCTIADTFTIQPKAAIVITASATRVSDKGSATGTIYATVFGGNDGTYTIALYEQGATTPLQSQSNVSSAHTFTGLRGTPEGKVYTIKAVDVRGCVNTNEVQVIEPLFALQLSDTISETVACFGYNNAEVTLSVTGGWGGYKYRKGNLALGIDSVFGGLHAGNYTFYVQDLYGGSDSVAVFIGQPKPLAVVRDTLFPVLCHGEATGWIRYKITGGTYPYRLLSMTEQEVTAGVSYLIENGDTLIAVNGLVAGTYNYLVRDSRGCTVNTVTKIIAQPTKLQMAVVGTRDITCEFHDGEIRAHAWGGVEPYSYVLSRDSSYSSTKRGFDSLAVVEYRNLYDGQYLLTVTDSNNCSESVLVTINAYLRAHVDGATVRDVGCFGESNGWVRATSVPGSNKVVEYTLKNRDESVKQRNTTGFFENLKADTYYIDVIDEIGCQSNPSYMVKVGEPDSLSIKVNAIQPSAARGIAGGKIFFNIAGGNVSSKTVRLRNNVGEVVDSLSGTHNGTNLSFENVRSGDYYLEVSDDTLGCQGVGGWCRVTEPMENLHLMKLDVKDALCKSQTGSIVVQGVGGWGGYRYKRAAEADYSEQNRFENLYPGNYVISVIDSMGTMFSETITVYEPQDSLQAAVVATQLPTCGNTGSLSVRVSGGTAPYMLYNQAKTDSIAALSADTVVMWSNFGAGNYLFYLIDANGCRFDLEATLSDSALLAIERVKVVKYPSLPGAANGSVVAVVKGGVAPYAYLWTGLSQGIAGQTRNDSAIGNLASGYYHLQVTDAQGCTVENQMYLTDPGDLQFYVVATGHESGFEAADGSVMLHSDLRLTDYEVISPTNSVVSYLATTSNSNFFIRGDTVYLQHLAGGKWFISGKTLDGQKVVVAFEIKSYPRFTFSSTTLRPASKRGYADGEIRVEVQGGGGNNRFTWTPATGTGVASGNEYRSILTDIPVGTYTVQVEDRYGRQLTQNMEVLEPAQDLHLSIVRQQNQYCATDQNAFVELAASGGWGDYQFRHEDTNYDNGASFINLATGKQYFYLIDKRGSIDSVQVTITDPDTLRTTVARVDSVRCKGGDDGRIVFDMRGGVPPYRFMELGVGLWTTGNEATSLRAGLHTFVFIDNNNCVNIDTLTIDVPEPDSLVFKTVTITHTTCGEDNGSITVSLKGGTKPYQYSWVFNGTEISTDSTIANLKSGSYSLTVTDYNGCTTGLVQWIKPSALPSITEIKTTDVLCFGDSTGTAKVTGITPAEPYAPYTLIWSNGDVGESSNHFRKGRHYVTLTDTNGCSTTRYFDIGEPNPLSMHIYEVQRPLCFGSDDGYIRTETMGGVLPYSYLWSTGDTTAHISNLTKGDYWVRVTDGNGCTYQTQTTLTEPDSLYLQFSEVKEPDCFGNRTGYILTQTVGGTRDYTYRWSTGDTASSIINLPKGDYWVQVTDKNKCSYTAQITLNEPEPLVLNVSEVKEPDCFGNYTGYIRTTTEGGTAPYAYLWSTGATTPHIENVPKGDYWVRVTDKNKCAYEKQITVHEPEPLIVSFSKVKTPDCFGGNTGNIDTETTGGTAPYTYLWSTGATTPSIKNVVKGDYWVRVTDKNGCLYQTSMALGEPDMLVLQFSEVQAPLCFGDRNGYIHTETAGGTGKYTYLWSTGATTPNIDNLPKGDYWVRVTDENGCSFEKQITLKEPEPLILSFSDVKEPQCFGSGNGYIHTAIAGGTASYTYLWSTGATTANIDNLPKGDYWVRVTDANGCSDEKRVSLDEPEYQTVFLGADILMCPGGQVTLDGHDYAAYRWFTAEKGTISTDRYLTVKEAGHYFLEATNSTGCSIFGDISVTIGVNGLQADFLMASEAEVGDTLVIYELSNMALDSLIWSYDTAVFERIETDDAQYILNLKCLQTGIYNIDLFAYSGGCYSQAIKQVEVVEIRDEDEDAYDGWGSQEPLIKSLNQFPNPTNGVFAVDLELREVADARVLIYEVASGVCVDMRSEQGASRYSLFYTNRNLNKGVYVLIVTAGNERRQVKIIVE